MVDCERTAAALRFINTMCEYYRQCREWKNARAARFAVESTNYSSIHQGLNCARFLVPIDYAQLQYPPAYFSFGNVQPADILASQQMPESEYEVNVK